MPMASLHNWAFLILMFIGVIAAMSLVHQLPARRASGEPTHDAQHEEQHAAGDAHETSHVHADPAGHPVGKSANITRRHLALLPPPLQDPQANPQPHSHRPPPQTPLRSAPPATRGSSSEPASRVSPPAPPYTGAIRPRDPRSLI